MSKEAEEIRSRLSNLEEDLFDERIMERGLAGRPDFLKPVWSECENALFAIAEREEEF